MRILLISLLYLCSGAANAINSRPIDEPGLVGTLYYTEGRHNQPAVVIVGGSGGGNLVQLYPSYMKTTLKLVNKGYAVLALSYFDYNAHSALPKSLTRVPLEYFYQAFEWVWHQPEVKQREVAFMGVSRGGELALLLASHYPQISTVVAEVPSAYVWGSYDKNRTPAQYMQLVMNEPCQSAWTLNGKDIANICNSYFLHYPSMFEMIEKPKMLRRAVIKAENMNAAVLLTSGSQDEVWPSSEMSRRVMKRLEANDYVRPYKHIEYPAGHLIHNLSRADIIEFICENYPANN